MSYLSVVEMAGSQSLLTRITAAAAGEGIPEPLSWAQRNIWEIVSAPDWDEAWDYANATRTADNNPDTGARPGVVNDQMILSAVQARRTAEQSAE